MSDSRKKNSSHQVIYEHLDKLSDAIYQYVEDKPEEIASCITAFKKLPDHLNDDFVEQTAGDIAMIKGFITAKTENESLLFVKNLGQEIEFFLKNAPSINSTTKALCETLKTELVKFENEIGGGVQAEKKESKNKGHGM